jgi:DNA polymerase-1
MGEKKLARNLNRTLDEAKVLFSQYHTALPFVRDTFNAAADEAKVTGFITTLLNRRRRFTLWQSSDFDTSKKDGAMSFERAVQKYGSRPGSISRAYVHKALNARLQGSAADIMKKAMRQLWESGVCDVLGAPLVTVHDELGLSVPDTDEAAEATMEVKHIMETAVKLKVPLVADMEIGPDWGHLK